MSYVDGFVIAVAKDKVEDYRKMAAMGCKVWMEYGALGYYECIGDDLESGKAHGHLTFPEMVDTKENETVAFAFIIYKSREHRDEVNAKVMADPRMNEMSGPMPFEMNRMAFGGFKAIVEHGNDA